MRGCDGGRGQEVCVARGIREEHGGNQMGAGGRGWTVGLGDDDVLRMWLEFSDQSGRRGSEWQGPCTTRLGAGIELIRQRRERDANEWSIVRYANATRSGRQNFDPGSKGPSGPYSCRPPLRFLACVLHSGPTAELTAPASLPVIGVTGDSGPPRGVSPGDVVRDRGA